MKHFKLIGPETTREFDIEDDELVNWNIFKITEFEKISVVPGFHPSIKLMKNEKIYPTEHTE